ncbi:895_t:CDS:2 [Funneliformis caledonium]|uniref:895_t:CDS:1 n=1 Tax=Funneliformis caledonium TaxID=1117310 RepID=A0A9N8ZSP7_9GLOM|nr:895_t:CDS:2 [Funneliformis caledonium]
MNRIFTFVFISLILASSFVKSTPLEKRQEPSSSDFKICDGDYAISLTSMKISPDPIVTGQNMTVNMVGNTAAVIENGAIVRIYHDPNGNSNTLMNQRMLKLQSTRDSPVCK